MAVINVKCPKCNLTSVTKRGTDLNGKQRYKCMNPMCTIKTFLLEYTYAGLLPEVKQAIVSMAANGSGIRDTARVLHVSPATVINELKKRGSSSSC